MLKQTTWAFSLVALIGCVACATEDDDGVGNSGGITGTGATGTGGFGTGGFSTGGTDAGLGGSSGGGTAGASGASGAAGTGGGADAGPTVTVTGRATGLLTPTTGISGIAVCLYQVASVPCVQTDTNGDYSLAGVPASSEVLLEYKKSGYLNVLRTVTTGTGLTDVGVGNFPTTNEAAGFAALVGTTIDPTKGQVLFSAFQPGTSGFAGQDGVTALMTPNSGSGPHYIKTSPTQPDPTLTATDTLGFGLYANVNPGTVDVTLTHPSKTCKRLVIGSFAGSGPTASKVPVVAGYLTAGAALECP